MTAQANRKRLEVLRQKLRERPMRTDLEPVREYTSEIIGSARDEDNLPTVVQVVGSNGKGSVVHYLSGLLSDQSARVTSYTSPHLRAINERIQLNNTPVEADKLEELLASFPEDFLESYTPFEALYLSALKYSLQTDSDFLLLEAGMGGRWDATSALTAEWVILTSLDREHTEYLGTNLADILEEKLAQLPDEGRVITGVLENLEDRDALTAMIQKKNATHIGLADRTTADETNRRLALTMARLLTDEPSVQLQATLDSLPKPPGRQEERTLRNRQVVFDVAHTPRSVRALLETLPEEQSESDRYLLYGSLQGKKTDRITDDLRTAFRTDNVVLTNPSSPRSLDADDLRSEWSSQETPNVVHSPEAGFETLMNQSSPGDLIVVAGSFHLVGAIQSEWLD